MIAIACRIWHSWTWIVSEKARQEKIPLQDGQGDLMTREPLRPCLGSSS
jgi:hypothetical protein